MSKNKSNNSSRRWIMGLFLLIAGLFSVVALAGCAPTATVTVITPKVYADTISTSDHMLVDVRTPEEFIEARIEGSINIPVEEMSMRLDEIPEDANIVLYCRSGNRSDEATQILMNAGYESIYDLGGIISWVEAGYPYING